MTVTDEDVFITILNEGNYHEKYNCIGYVSDSVYDLVKDTGRAYSTTTSQQIVNSLNVLSSAQVEFETYNIHFSGRLVTEFTSSSKDVFILLHEDISKLMHYKKLSKEEKNRGTIRHINMNLRSQLSLTGRAIHRFIYGHKAKMEYNFRIDTIHKATAPQSRLDNFKDELSKTLAKLIEVEFLLSGNIEKKYGEEYVTYRRNVV